MGPRIAESPQPRLRAEGLSKTFGSARVLKDADLRIDAGQIHALIGANGSGKSTLIKCVTGVEKPDRGGVLEIDGHEVHGEYTTKVAHDLGVRVVHQEAPLIDNLTLAETVGHHHGFPTAGPLIRRRKLARESKEIFERLGVEVDPGARASTLSPPERAMVMLALALGSGEGRLIVLDEPTASLTSGDAERFLEAVKDAAAEGAGVLLVTHRLQEVFAVCESVTVLRDGAVVAQTPTSATTADKLIDEIVGPAVDREAVRAANVPPRFLSAAGEESVAPQSGEAAVALEAAGLRTEVLDDVSLRLDAGEILGVSGLLGSGAAELCGVLAGVLPLQSGSVKVRGKDLSTGFDVREAMAAGVSYVPGDRLREGGIGRLTLVENMTLPNLEYYGLNRRRRLEDFEQIVAALDVRPPEPRRPFGTLSGGNQQKVIIGKWALMRPRVFLLDNPTAGVDPGAREDILRLLQGLAQSGTAVLVHSSEPEELARLATRVLVVRDGAVVTELRGDEVTERAIAAAS